ncbi:MAG: molecular chaperone DnaK [Desulfobacterales bacterium C00003060]|nr:MAG: molecular chaperone DnaK [Desulfobacterales bacterium C00003060]OEU84501.1 MAG: molecular chaperone DnaK [Desulfobacterales bacterium S5133MH4]
MAQSRYIVSIDLGTTNCAVAYADTLEQEQDGPKICLLRIPQLVASGTVEEQQLLPSFSYQIVSGELPQDSLGHPWQEETGYVVGAFARERGAEVPDRVISSSKSWLSHSGADRTAPILPWDAPEEVPHISPIEASSRLLKHIRDAWNYLVAAENPDLYLEIQEIFLTVPASFDATARDLTVRAAEMAGISRVTLLEEPQAAFYAWIRSSSNGWQREVSVGDVILVCDIGGGTTDFSLILVSEDQRELVLERIAVGDHVLLGGDNIDLTLAYAIRNRLAGEGTRLDNWQMRGLLHSSRQAKEKIFEDPDCDSYPITVLGKGRQVVGGTINTDLTRQEIEGVILDGFFPKCSEGDRPSERHQAGLKELGLPYASDPAVTRHMAWFLQRHRNDRKLPGGFIRPTAVLFNGGVMKAEALKQRVIEVLESWSGGEERLKVLASGSLDLAVAYGGVYYGLARRGHGIRIRSGTERTYYIGIETAMPAVPGMPTPIKALCVVPFGMEEGTEANLPDRRFGLVVGEPVSFRFLGSTSRHDDRIGDVIEDWEEEGIEELVPLEIELPAEEDMEGTPVRVRLHIKVTEIGTLELWFFSEAKRWKLEFNVRQP